MSDNQQGRLDGLPVELYDGRFGGTFEMDQETGTAIAYDDVLTFMVVGVAGKCSFDTNKSGDLKRTNTFEVTNVNIVPNDIAVKLANELGTMVDGVNGGQLSLTQIDPTTMFDDDNDDDEVFTPAPLRTGRDADLDEFLNEGWDK